MTLADQYRSDGCAISFELFPPKTSDGIDSLCENVERLMQFQPRFFTCTYGAGGSSQGTTLEVLQRVKQLTNLPVASHLTCVGSSTQQLCEYLRQATEMGIDYIVALRGDPPKGTTEFSVTEGGLRYANELVDLIRQNFPNLGVAVAGYPEVHQEAIDAQTDLGNLKRKVDAGADIVITQLFYENSDFYRFRDDCSRAGINVPIVPGILPVTNFKQAQKIAGMCKAAIPNQLAEAMMKNDSAEHQFRVGVEHARQQTIDLMDNGVPGIHYYVLNRSAAAAELLDGLQMAGT
ncbi:methylenetetrahydrofolate reductase [NAD(P)H] [Allorhodopirellula heiligendammensis]|uniref:Methylenetetrahydrofolate reductase n=1 Tax=Allorhodopirellula heiligendammensis TaxID=2714739 RepID=A0A5C6C3M0_9BACT|nr:methylenetetrahydrofolate reductase [NAD(P)H] [Allorhodopirellula heiligendammensis]TWU18116.1 5,10-methylenetetrahydrofolate reductase [Allorhodopirellula heiligendammensis]